MQNPAEMLVFTAKVTGSGIIKAQVLAFKGCGASHTLASLLSCNFAQV